MEAPVYSEKIRSNLTSSLFASLALAFLVLFIWRLTAAGWTFLTGLCLFLGAFFLFYIINYRTLRIRITDRHLLLRFGLISWKTKLDNIASCQPDDAPWFIRYGGAGVHFAMVRGSYRAFFNFLEHPRVMVTLREKQGPVRQLSFSTRHPERVRAALERRAD